MVSDEGGVCVFGSYRALTEFVCLSVVARGDVAKDFASGNAGRNVLRRGCSCGV